MFEQATRSKIRFPSNKGELSVEQIWDLPLESKTGFDLDSVAKAINSQLKSVTEESFVATTTSPAKSRLTLQLDIVKHVIATKIAENKAARDRAANAAERNKLLDILGTKEDEELKGLTKEELLKRIEALNKAA
jgi:hypothetical protein